MTRWLLIALLATAGCEANNAAEPAGPDAGHGPDVTNGFDDDTVYLYGVVGVRGDGWFPEGVAGAELCVVSHPELPCVTTDAEGGYRLDGVPADTDIVVVATHAGHVSGATQARTYPANGQQVSIILSEEINVAAMVRPLGYEFPLGDTGIISFSFRNYTGGGLGGAVITASSGDVVYTGDGGLPDPDRTESRRGDGFVFDVTPGFVTLDVQADGYRCNLGEMTALAGDGPNQVVAVVHPGTITNVGVTCAAQTE